MVKIPQICHWNFDPLCHSSKDYVFPVLATILLLSVVGRYLSCLDTIVELALIEYSRFTVGVSFQAVVVLVIKLFPVLPVILPFPVSVVVSVACVQLRARRGQKS